MDKSWMRAIKWSKAYIDGVNTFMKFVETHMGRECDVRCPCMNCLNLLIQDQKTVKDHILEKGIDPGYITWFYHGEPSNSTNSKNHNTNEGDRIDSDSISENDDEEDGVQDMIADLAQHYESNTYNMPDGNSTNIGGLPAYLEALMIDAKTELYPGCKKISRTSFIIQLLHLKVYNKLSNKAIDMILRLLKLSYPDGETLPSTCYEAKIFLRDLGLGYECIHACKYDCTLFWKDNENMESCPTCGTSRWKINDGIGKKIPQKILRYFPLRPRLQRLFLSQKTSKMMVWHKENRIDDDYMRHPADALAWKDFDNKFPWFANDPRNVRLALAADGFNPFGNLSTTYSMWPVILAPLNLPPWDCMKEPFLMLSLLIPGKNSPGKDIDVYLQPLIAELKELWVQGVETFDVSTKNNFLMHAAVLWTINDFPAYGDLSGWSTKGYMACPVCNEQAYSMGLRNKVCYMGHRRYLPNEALLGGPIHFRWMYPIERSLCTLKHSVRNKAHPEGSVAEAYIARESLTFCSMYLRGIETRFNRDERNIDISNNDSLSIFSQKCRPFGATKYVELSDEEFDVIQWFVFQNCEEVEQYFEWHKDELLSGGCQNIDKEHKEQYPAWFKKHMTQLYHKEPSKANESLYSLACAPHRCVRKYTGCIVNGVKFLTKERDSRRKSQNSGIVVEGNHGEDTIDFYGILIDIILLDYVRDRHVTIFKCDWFDLGRKKAGIQKEGNIVSVKITGTWYKNDSYILADQARQVFYINDPKLGRDWRVVQPFQHRHIYDVDEMQDEVVDVDSFVEDGVYQENNIDDDFQVGLDEVQSLNRDDMDPEDIEELVIENLPEVVEAANLEEVDEENEFDDTVVDYYSSEEHSQNNRSSDSDGDDDDWET